MVRHTLKILQQMHLRVNIFLFWAVSVKFLKKRVLTYKKKTLVIVCKFFKSFDSYNILKHCSQLVFIRKSRLIRFSTKNCYSCPYLISSDVLCWFESRYFLVSYIMPNYMNISVQWFWKWMVLFCKWMLCILIQPS